MNTLNDFFWVFLVIVGVLFAIWIILKWFVWLLKKAWEVIDRMI